MASLPATSGRPSPAATLHTDRDGVILEISAAAARLFGRAGDGLQVTHLSALLCDAEQWLARLRAEGPPGPLRVDGQWLVPGSQPVHLPAWVESEAGGGSLRWVLLDLPLPAAEEALRREREKFQALIDAVPCTLSWVSSDLRYLLVNHQVAALLGTMPDEFVGKEVGYRGKDPFFVDFVRSVFRSPEPRTVAEISIDANGDPRTFLLVGSRYADDREATIIGLDITQRKRMEEALRESNEQLTTANTRSAEALVLLKQARDQADAANRAKDRFLSHMSHEMLTPLNGVLGLADLLLTSPTGSDAQDLVRKLQASACGLRAIIRDVLAVSAPGEERSETSVPFELRSTVEAAVGSVATAARQRGLSTAVQVAASVPRTVRGDPGLLGEILRRLLDNAVKFTEEGQVALSVTPGDSDPEHVELEFAVTDTGVGVVPERQGLIFEPFVQADGSATRTHGGAGLGLSIASRLAARIGGKLGVESPPTNPLPGPGGPGSVFRLTTRFGRMPAQFAEARGTSVAPAPYRPLHVLVAEDNSINRLVARRHLEAEGHRVAFAEDGLEAVAACRRECFDAVLMDIQMPRLDGFKALAAIRAGEAGDARRVPVIALTAHDFPGYEERCLASGMDGFVPKPLQREVLVKALQRVTGIAAARSAEAPSGAPTPSPLPVSDRVAFDREASLALAGGDGEFLGELARVFLEDCPELLGAVRGAAAAEDPPGLRAAAHALKGAIAAFAAPRAWQAARDLENQGRSGSLSGVGEGLAALEAAVQDLCGHLAIEAHPMSSTANGGGGS